MAYQGIVTGLPGARSWPGARAGRAQAAAPPVPGGELPGPPEGWGSGWPMRRRRPSGARFRSRGRHAEPRGRTRRAPSEWPFGPHAPARTPGQLPGHTSGHMPGQTPAGSPARVQPPVRDAGVRRSGAASAPAPWYLPPAIVPAMHHPAARTR